VKHAPHYGLLLTETDLTRRPFGAMAQRIAPCRWRRGNGSSFVNADGRA
jgi:hypothetical protein